MFRVVFQSIIRSSRLYIQHQVYVIQVRWLHASGICGIMHQRRCRYAGSPKAELPGYLQLLIWSWNREVSSQRWQKLIRLSFHDPEDYVLKPRQLETLNTVLWNTTPCTFQKPVRENFKCHGKIMMKFKKMTQASSLEIGIYAGYISQALQVGRSVVRSPMVSLEFFIDIIHPAAIWFWGRLSF